MISTTLLPVLGLVSTASAHFHLLQPIWRGDSFTAPASQWQYPCANVNATPSDSTNRTQWPLTGGSVVFNGSHPWALTYVNLGIGTNASNFNISLVPAFNQTGPGVFCFKETQRVRLEEGLKAAGYSGLGDARLNGLDASVQVIQLGERGSALYNCADIKFNATAQLLSDDQCKNGTGVGGVAIANVQSGGTPTGSASPTRSSGAATKAGPILGSGIVAAVIAWGWI
ncbi:hypothetical protein ACEQ8H_004785 [Pleosporales sp. CAS-2024a]